MKTIPSFLITLLLIIFSCSGPANQGSAGSGSVESASPEMLLVDEILENSDNYTDQKVRVEGMVSHVCKHSGKRLHLTSKSTGKMIRVEAADGINQFERELEGSDIIVEGVFHMQVIDEDYLAKWENEGLEGEGVHLEHSSAEAEAKEEQIMNMRKQLQESGKDRLVSLWIDGNNFQVK
jgi:cytochrome c-type biogenesis protein CcmE